ncbi:MAG TPA: SIS domain-containing protein [Anaerolineae bacterium]|nr:SIS domain-containing protein [Anaerolineae bacterium]
MENDFFAGYFDEVYASLRAIARDRIVEVVALLRQVRSERRRVFIFGNGGSAATSSHFACDLIKLTRQQGLPDFRVIALTDNMPVFSAYANDHGYDTVFAAPLKSLAEPGDVAIGISASGRSANVLRGMDVAQELGLFRVGFAGYDGGVLKDKVDVCLIAPGKHASQIEDAHHVLQHAICRAIIETE